MKKAIELGKLGMNRTSPNPKVGCVLVKNGNIIGKGYHRKFGEKHAEIEAIESAAEKVEGSTAYITLEPCTHQGKTPPCTDRLISEKIKRVVIGTEDPNPKVKGIEILKKNGIRVGVGVLRKETEELIKDYLKFTSKKKPFIIVKTALSWDGKIATRTGESKWISGEEARNYTMRIRGEVDSIITGARTVNIDDPELTYRLEYPPAEQPLRVVIDGKLNINPYAKIVDENTIIITLSPCDIEKKKKLQDKGVEVVEFEGEKGYISPKRITDYLYSKKIMSVLIEAGGSTAGNFIYEREIDRIIYIYSPIIIGGEEAPTACNGPGFSTLKDSLKLKNTEATNLGPDLMLKGDLL